MQFKGHILERWKHDIETTDAAVFGYIPNNAYLVKMNSSVRSSVESFDHVQWVGEYKAEYKISPELSKSSQETEDIIVILFDPEVNLKVCEDIETIGGEIVNVSGEVIRIRIDTSRISEIAAIDGVKWIEEYVQPVIFNNVSRDITGVSYVSDTYGLTGRGQIIGIADTGLDTGINDATMHDDLEERILKIFDLVGDGSADLNGHGTHVAGSVLGNGSASDGNYTGMAPEAELVFQAVAEDKFGSIVGIPNDLTQLFQQSYDEGARIHTNSWGVSVYGRYNSLSHYTDKFMWEHPDMLILFSAGNHGEDSDLDGVVDPDSITSPATAKNCISVGASENYRGDTFTGESYTQYGLKWPLKYPIIPIKNDYMANNPDGIAAFSSRGPTNDGRIKPDIVAPGTFIASTRSSMASTRGWGIIDENYLYMGGTSMATPITAGSAALVRQNYMENLNTTPSAALIKATIINGAHDMTPGQYGTNSTQEIEGRPDYSQGWGRLDIKESLYPSGERKIHFIDKLEISTGETFENEYYIINSSQPLRVTLVWTDYPAEASAAITLVNDLDLYVIGPDGTYMGNGGDNINNVEQVVLQSPVVGTYNIEVSGTNIPQGPQPFSIVVSGAVSKSVNIHVYPGDSIQNAIDVANPGNTIIVYPGTYTENVDVDKELMIISQSGNPENTIIQAADPEDDVFYVTADNVTISGFTIIDAVDSYYDNLRAGVFLDEVKYCNISNNKLSNNDVGIRLDDSSNNTLNNNTASSNSGHGIYLCYSSNYNELANNTAELNNGNGIFLQESSNSNTLRNNIVCNNNRYGIQLLDASNNNTIYNNFFNNTDNTLVSIDSTGNVWNIIKTAGSNIIDGPFLGGNYWATPAGTGFSQTHADSNRDGFCDSTYIIDENNIDYLPLSNHPSALALRSLPMSIVPGEQFTITVNVVDYGLAGKLVETIPAGFTFDGSTHGSVEQSGQTITFFLLGSDSVQYTVTAAGGGGTYDFTGTLTDFNKVEYAVEGDNSIRIGFHPLIYDFNDNGLIEKNEVMEAIRDYFSDKITKDEVIEVIVAYFSY